MQNGALAEWFGYHLRVTRDLAAEPPFDPRWLAGLAEATGGLSRQVTPRLEDLYLERRLEVRVVQGSAGPEVEVCRTEGVAARWHLPSRTVLLARTGASPKSVRGALEPYSRGAALPGRRPLPAPEVDMPRGWDGWAERLAAASAGSLEVRLLRKRAAVIRDGGWTPVDGPTLVRVHGRDAVSGSLLSVWGHPSLGRWLELLTAPPPSRPWSPPSGTRLPVLFAAPTAGAILHEVIGHLAESDLVGQRLSPFAPLAAAAVAPSSLTVVDDPGRGDLPGSFTHDDEGLPGRPIPLVREGILCGLLCDTAGARKLGHPPGRGRRAAWDTPPVARMSNLVVAPGDAAPADLERSITSGLLVTRTGAAAVDPTSGSVVVRIERGWELRNGRRRRELAPLHLVGSALRLLAAVDSAVGDDPEADWRLGWCVKDGLPIPTGGEAPSLLVHELEVL